MAGNDNDGAPLLRPDVAMAALESAEMGVCVLDLVNERVDYDPGFRRLLGVGDRPLSDRYDDLFRMVPSEDAARAQAALDAHLAGHTDAIRVEHRIERADGRVIWIETRGRITRRNEWGEPVEVTSVIQDCSRRHAAERSRKQLEQQLAHVQRMESVGALVGGIAHDFNNMLLAIAGHTELALVDLQDGAHEAVVESLDEIKQSTARAAELTRRLLSFGRQGDGMWDDADMRARLENLRGTLESLVPESIELEIDFGREPLWIKGDAARIEQALVNLCANAVDAIDERGKICVEAGRVELDASELGPYPWAHPGDFVAIRVIDDGCGIADDVIERVFDPFFTTKEVGEGTGLGLSIAFATAKHHEGLLRVRNHAAKPSADHGACFEMLIPERGSTGARTRPEATATTQGSERTRSGGAVILVAEDDAPVRKVVERMLGSAGYRVISAADGAEAMALFDQHEAEIDLVLLDAIMPQKTGREVYEEIIARRPELKVMFASGYTADVLDHGFFERERRPLLSKPFSRDVLLERIASLLDS